MSNLVAASCRLYPRSVELCVRYKLRLHVLLLADGCLMNLVPNVLVTISTAL